jgi:hypothetical protein
MPYVTTPTSLWLLLTPVSLRVAFPVIGQGISPPGLFRGKVNDIAVTYSQMSHPGHIPQGQRLPTPSSLDTGSNMSIS